MKKIVLKFTCHSDLIIVPDSIAQNIHSIRMEFDKWLYDKSNNHDYWVYINGKKKAVSFDSNAFVDYLNNIHLVNNKEKSYIIQKKIERITSEIPILFF